MSGSRAAREPGLQRRPPTRSSTPLRRSADSSPAAPPGSWSAPERASTGSVRHRHGEGVRHTVSAAVVDHPRREHLLSPALADVARQRLHPGGRGNRSRDRSGSVWVLNAADGQPIWHRRRDRSGHRLGGDGGSDRRGATRSASFPLSTGFRSSTVDPVEQVANPGSDMGVQNAPLVTQDPNGTIGITVAGYSGTAPGQGVVDALRDPGFERGRGRRAPARGRCSTTTRSSPAMPAERRPRRHARLRVPSAALQRIRHGGRDGGIFTFGNEPFCGSTGGVRAQRTGGRHGQAPEYGRLLVGGRRRRHLHLRRRPLLRSMGGQHLNTPIVGMAATPTAAATGGRRRRRGLRLRRRPLLRLGGRPAAQQPVVGISARRRPRVPPGRLRRWHLHFGERSSSAQRAAHCTSKAPIVAMATTCRPAATGWSPLDGGIFTFDAALLWVDGGRDARSAVVGMRPATTPTATAWSPRTGASSPSTPSSTGRWAVSTSTGRLSG